MRAFLQRRFALLAVGGIALAALGWWVFLKPPALPLASGEFPQGAYLWQRQWTDGVRSAVAWAGGERSPFAGLCVAYAEIDANAGAPPAVLRTANLDWTALAQSRAAVGVAVRVREFGGEVSVAREPFLTLCGVIREILARAEAAGLRLAEVQVDFDCPVSRLRGFAEWMRALQEMFPAQTLRFTALPTWLHSRDFPGLARAAGGYVLQLHSLDKPGPDARPPVTLCDPARAAAAVERAARLGVPFRVALPTYGYRLVLDASGRLLAAAGEGATLESAYPPAGGSRRTLGADPAALAGLVRGWQTRRPATLQGVIWYRLPVTGDRLNWTARTLLAVMAGRTPQPRLGLRFTRGVETAPYDLRLCNDGEADAPLPPTIAVRCPVDPLAADGVGGFDLQPGDLPPPELLFALRPGERADARVLPAGASLSFGWVRLGEGEAPGAHEPAFTGRLPAASLSLP